MAMDLTRTPFLTQLDPRGKIKGSRDPLGFQPLWTALGRHVVHNLTTVTTSLRDFTTLLLGYYFAEAVVENGDCPLEDFTNLFLKFEQLSAYSRFACNPESGSEELEIRGILRVKERIRHNGGVVRISASPEHQILSDQKTYGLWGLYSVASRNSGFLEQAEPRLTGIAREFVEREYLPRLDRDGDVLFPFLRDDRNFAPAGRDKRLAKQLAALLSSELTEPEREEYDRRLLGSNDAEGMQRMTWETILEISRKKRFSPGTPFSMAELREMIKAGRTRGWNALAERLENIHAAERVLAPAAVLFNYLQDRDQRDIPSVANEVRTAWKQKLQSIDPEALSTALGTIKGMLPDMKQRLVFLAEALASADYSKAVQLLLEQNTEVMRERGGSPWILVQGRDVLDVRYREGTAGLTDPSELTDLWINTYFLNALKDIGFQIHGDTA